MRTHYHHGALRQALLDQAEILLAEQGVDAFSLRELARRVGVSPSAPSHHFGDTTGLLVEVAILGFEELNRYLDAGHDADPDAAVRRAGEGYVRFALAYPARFKLMFRREKLRADERLEAAGGAAFGRLQQAVERALPAASTPAVRAAAVARAWSIVHGYAYLALDGQLAAIWPQADRDPLGQHYLSAVLGGA